MRQNLNYTILENWLSAKYAQNIHVRTDSDLRSL